MPLRVSRFGLPRRPRRRLSSGRVVVFRPDQGFDVSEPASDLPAGYSPSLKNWVTVPGGIQPRSGLSQFGNPFLCVGCSSAPVLGGAEIEDVAGNRFGLILSERTVRMFEPAASSWNTFRYDTSSTDTLSGNTLNYFSVANIYDLTRDQNIAVFTNGVNLPKYFEVTNSVTTYSDLTQSSSFLSKAASVTAADDRLVFFNISELDAERPNRVAWSTRGNPQDYSVVNGAGFEDLFDMRGVGRAVIDDDNGLVLFSDKEVWRGAPLRGQFSRFAFDFFAINEEIGCPYPNTVAKTPIGVIFLASDLELYLVRGNDVIPIGPREQQDHSRVQKHISDNIVQGWRAFAFYNRNDRRYELYYSTGSATYPNRALYYEIENGAFSDCEFAHELTYGYSFRDPSAVRGVTTWDGQTEQWDNLSLSWNDIRRQVMPGTPNDHALVFSSVGTAYRFRSDQTTDDSTPIPCRWRSHGLGLRNQFRQDIVDQVWLEYDCASNSSVSIYMSTDGGTTFGSGQPSSLASSAHSMDHISVFALGRSPQFEIRLTDGTRPRITRLQARVRDAGDF